MGGKFWSLATLCVISVHYLGGIVFRVQVCHLYRRLFWIFLTRKVDCTWLFCSNRERSIPLRGRHQLSMQMCRYNACLPLNPCYLFAKMNQRCLLNIDRHTYNWDNIDEYVLVPSKDYIEENMTCADINFQMKPCMFRSVFCSMSRMWSANFCVAKTWWCM